MRHVPVPITAVFALGATLAVACAPGEPSGSASTAPEAGEDTGTGGATDPLVIGSIVPQAGPLAFLGPPLVEAGRLAVSEINAAGGVLGQPIPAIQFVDDSGDAAIASQSAGRLLRRGVDAIVGAAGSGMPPAVIDEVTGANVVQCSPSDTTPALTHYDDGGYYFRTAPSDALQGRLLAEQMAGDGATRVGLVARADDYGRGLVTSMAPALEEAGVEVVAAILYEPRTTNFDATIEQLAAVAPDAVAIIALDEGARLLRGITEVGSMVSDVELYGSDGLRQEALADAVSLGEPERLAGLRGTAGDPRADPDFIDRLTTAAPSLTETSYAAHTFDCFTIVALAAQSAGSTSPTVFAGHIVGVTRDGEKCTTFAECLAILARGGDIDYDGPSGPLEFSRVGEPQRSVYEIWEFDASGTLRSLGTRESP